MNAYVYLIVVFGCLLIPFLASFYPKHPFYKEWKYFLPANIGIAIPFLIWDYLFTKAGIWGFNPEYLSGLYLTNLPIEEILFFVFIPYACVFTFFALQYLLKKNPLKNVQKYISIVLIIALTIVGLIHYDRWYTSTSFLLLSGYLLFALFRKTDLSYIYLSYFLILPFFLISNGVLTGSGLENPIVWYNDAENLGIRIFTIPIEDSVYGLLLIGLNIHLYQFIKKYSVLKEKYN